MQKRICNVLDIGKKRHPRKTVGIPNLDPELVMQIKLLAISRDMTLKDTYDMLLRRGLATFAGKVKLPKCMESVEMYIVPKREKQSKRRT